MTVNFRSDMTVELVKSDAADENVIWAARVSTMGEKAAYEVPEARKQGLIRYLAENRHGCYTPDTEVLTSDGWKFWDSVSMEDTFATLNLEEDRIEYQSPTRVIDAEYTGDIVEIKTNRVSLTVTPNHNLLVSKRLNSKGRYSPWYLEQADSITGSFKVRRGGGTWEGVNLQWSDAELELLGFFVGDGNSTGTGTTPTFNIRKEREISFLNRCVSKIPGASVSVLKSGARSVRGLSKEYRNLLLDCYSQDREKIIPQGIIDGTPWQLLRVYLGLMNSDGSTSGGRRVYHTTSKVLSDQVQELVLKIGASATINKKVYPPGTINTWGGPRKDKYSVHIFTGRQKACRVGWTLRDRERQISRIPYSGRVYCATVPNGTLYVRKGGKAVWCGNSPFEHSTFTFRVEVPIFVAREVFRHRIASYNEWSGRYSEMLPSFYIPARERPLQQVGKAAHYQMVEGTDDQFGIAAYAMENVFKAGWETYQRLLQEGIAREVARNVLPLATYTTFYMTLNARALMNFLSLRTHEPEAASPSHPLFEIELMARQMETIFAEKMPYTYEAWNNGGRVAP